MIIFIPLVSIHALVKRATYEINISCDYIGVSIHALVKRATLSHLRSSGQHNVSIHALVKRATLVSLSILYRAFVFQSTPS